MAITKKSPVGRWTAAELEADINASLAKEAKRMAKARKNRNVADAFANFAVYAIEHGASDDTQVALDAAQSGRPDAYKLLVGVPCTVSIGSDSYAGKIEDASPSLQTITVTTDDGEERAFRLTKRGYTSRPWRLTIGHASVHRDPHR